MILKTELKTEEEKRQFQEALKQSRFSSTAAFLRYLIKLYVLNSAEKRKGSQPIEQPESEADLKPVKFTVGLPDFVIKGVTKRAGLYGLNPTVYIRSLLAANLTHRPILVKNQVDELRAANRELASIGRNLNQIAKTMNQAVDLKVRDRVNYQHIVELRAGIEKQKEAIYKMVAESNNVWRVK